ncbi:MAG TPA: Hsp20/alpha crystallin family protein [Polyangia bacterium]|jgi:HSP20 family molecular chaperone IbpA|nr:Hsp20/alpha crystallin family protein [Polyangia bacterium]
MSTQNQIINPKERARESVAGRPVVAPAVDIYENAEEILLVADLPGVTEEGLVVRLEKDQLSIEGRMDLPQPGTALATGFRAVDYRREFVVPKGIDADKIAATLKLGVLRVKLPKVPALKPRQITVQAG